MSTLTPALATAWKTDAQLPCRSGMLVRVIRPWSVARKYQRERNPQWSEYICNEGNQQLLLGKENYMVSADGFLMPVKKGQAPPDLKNFNQAR